MEFKNNLRVFEALLYIYGGLTFFFFKKETSLYHESQFVLSFSRKKWIHTCPDSDPVPIGMIPPIKNERVDLKRKAEYTEDRIELVLLGKWEHNSSGSKSAAIHLSFKKELHNAWCQSLLSPN